MNIWPRPDLPTYVPENRSTDVLQKIRDHYASQGKWGRAKRCEEELRRRLREEQTGKAT